MNEFAKEFLSEYGAEIIKTVLMAVLTAIAAGIKTICKKYADTKTKKTIVLETVRYVEQICRSLTSTEKFKNAMLKAQTLLRDLGIKYNESELEIMIESAVNECFPHEGI